MAKKIDADDIMLDDRIIYAAALGMLNDVKLQLSFIDFNNTYEKYEMFDVLKQFGRKNYFKERIKMPEADRWADATGEFGLEPTNPILVADTLGQLAYLSHLRWDGKPVIFFSGSATQEAVFSMYAFSLDGDHLDKLYFDPFHRFQSKSVPRGYTWAAQADGLTGTHCVINDKMSAMAERIYSDAKEMFGVAVVSPSVSKFNVEAAERLWNEYKKSRSRG